MAAIVNTGSKQLKKQLSKMLFANFELIDNFSMQEPSFVRCSLPSMPPSCCNVCTALVINTVSGWLTVLCSQLSRDLSATGSRARRERQKSTRGLRHNSGVGFWSNPLKCSCVYKRYTFPRLWRPALPAR